MAKNKGNRKERDFTFHHSQDDLSNIDIVAPLSKKHEQFLTDEDHDVILFGGAAGSGKSHLSLIRILQAAMFDGNYVAGILRRSQKQIKGPGSLWATGNDLFKAYGASSNSLEMQWKFESGANVKCHYLHQNTDDFQGTQVTEWLVDEATQCAAEDVWYLLSRLRSKSKRRHQLRMTCNPDRDSFLREWLEKGGYLLESGLPDPERDGKTTYMLEIQGRLEFFDTKKEIVELYGQAAGDSALSFVFYSATVYDNPYIRKHQPSYVFKLEQMKRLERERLLLGNWLASEGSEGYLRRESFNSIKLADVPLGLSEIRAWDIAGSKPSESYPDPDWTRGVKCSYDKETGDFYILDLKSMRDRAALVDRLILDTALQDGRNTYVSVPQDSGAAGKEVAQRKKARLLAQGNKALVTKTKTSKLTRAQEFLIAVQSGQVYVVDGVFNNEHYNELEAFTGKRNGWHDDLVDALADAYTILSSNRLIAPIKVGKDNPRLRVLGGSTLL